MTRARRSPASSSSLTALDVPVALGAVLLAASGCGFGFGSAFVGEWTGKRQVDFEACLREPAGPSATNATPEAAACKDRKEVVTDLPPRRFWGVLLPMLQLGASSVSFRDREDSVEIRFQPSIEFLRGKGRWAYGLRAGLLSETGGSTERRDDMLEEEMRSLVAWDVTAVGRVSVHDRLALHAGVGYLPYAGFDGESTNVGARGLVGVQIGLSKVHTETRFVLTLELDHLAFTLGDDPYRSTSLTGLIGIFF
jgi:hypothetical protein